MMTDETETPFAKARRTMSEALKTDKGLNEAYQSNVAMLLHDRWGITDHEKRNRAAAEILHLIFHSV